MEHWEFIIGIVVQTLLFLGGGFGMVLRNDWSTKALAIQLQSMQAELQKLADVITMQAVQTTRIDNVVGQVSMLQRIIEDLRRGNGWMGNRKSVDGEYP